PPSGTLELPATSVPGAGTGMVSEITPAGLVPDSTVTGGGVTVGVGVSGVQAAINTMSNKMAARRIHASSESMRTPLDEFYQNKTEIAFLNLTPASLRSTPPLHAVERGLGVRLTPSLSVKL